MADVDYHPLLHRIRGAIGGLVFKTRNGKPYVARRPDMSDYEPSPAQREQRSRFAQAQAFARSNAVVPEAHAYYRDHLAGPHGRTLQNVLVGDFMTRPVVRSVTLDGEPRTLRVDAYDPYGIVRVTVALYDGEGLLMEGDATLERARWVYPVPSGVPGSVAVRVRAWDWPGNEVGFDTTSLPD